MKIENMAYVKMSDVKQAVLNWQNAVGGSMNGQLETFLGISLGVLNDHSLGLVIDVASESILIERVKTLLSENHPTMIKVWLARNK